MQVGTVTTIKVHVHFTSLVQHIYCRIEYRNTLTKVYSNFGNGIIPRKIVKLFAKHAVMLRNWFI